MYFLVYLLAYPASSVCSSGDGDARVTSNEQKSGQMAHDPKAALAKLADGLVVMSDNLQQKKREPRMPQHLEEASAPEPLRPDPADARSVVIEETYEFQVSNFYKIMRRITMRL